MAKGVISAGIDVATNSRADKVVFGDKSLSKLGEGDRQDDSSQSSSESTPIQPKDFFWDQLVVYLVSAILALGFLNISIEFFRGSQVQCFNPNDSSRQQDAYVNDFCYGSLPDSQYYLIFILISAVLIVAPHYLWDSYFTAHFSFFFDLVKKLSRLRDSGTGNYNRKNFEIVKKLEEKFKGKQIGIFRLYVLKLFAQLCFSFGVLFADAFYFRIDDFHESFFCPANVSEFNTTQPVPLWHFDQPMACVYNSLRLLSFIHKASFILVIAAVVVLFGGLCWTFLRHKTELGAKEIANFCDQSCLPPEVYTFPSLSKVIMSIVTCGRSNKHLRDEHMRAEREHRRENQAFMAAVRSGLNPAFSPRIQSDLDFLLLRLFRADSGHGHVFKDIQVYKELQQKFSEDHQQLFLLNRVHHDWLDRALKQLTERRRNRTEGTDSAAAPTLDVTRADENWERLEDMRKFFYESGLKNIGRNPEETVYTFFKADMGVNPGDWTNSPLRSVLYGLLQFSPSNRLAIDVSFGISSGYSLVLARAFLEVTTIHFNHFYHNLKEVCREDVYQTNLKTITVMDDIYSQNTHNILKLEKLIANRFKTREDGGIDLIVIGPITDKFKIITTNLLIEKLYSPKYFSKEAILMAVRPLMVGSKSRMGHFVQFNPPKGLFDDINEEVEAKLHDANVHLFQVSDKGKVTHIANPRTGRHTTNESSSRTTNGNSQSMVQEQTNTPATAAPAKPANSAKGMVVECSGVECIFEFRLFRYKSDKYAPSLQELQEQRRRYEEAERLKHSSPHLPRDASDALVSNGPRITPHPLAHADIPPHSHAGSTKLQPDVPVSPSLDPVKDTAVNGNPTGAASSHVEPDRRSMDSNLTMENGISAFPPTDDHKQLGLFASVDSESSFNGHHDYQRGESQQPLLEKGKD